MSYCECTGCGEMFGSVKGFDAHRVGRYSFDNTRRCLSPKEIKKKGLTKNKKGIWTYPAPAFISEGVDKEGKK